MLPVLAVALGIWLAYSWRIGGRGGPGAQPSSTPAPPRGLYAAVALAFAAAALLEYLPVYWAVKDGTLDIARQNLADLLPLHAFLIGGLVGFLFADQTLADERAAAQAAGRGGDGEAKQGVLRTAIANAGIAVLVLAAVIPPSALMRLMNRLQIFEAGGVKLAFAGGGGSNLAEAIRTASPPRSQWTGGSPSGKGGFVPIRLDTMVELTHPPSVVSGDPRAGVFRNAVGYISAELGPAPPVLPDRDASGYTRRVQRDRALLWEMEAAAAEPGAEPPAAVQGRLRDLGRAQEVFLAMFAQHVGCLAGFIEATRDRRLVDYRNVHLVQELFVLAHTWSKYEKRIALEGIFAPGAARRAPPAAVAGRFPQAVAAGALSARNTPGKAGTRAGSGAAATVAAAAAAASVAQAAGSDAPPQAAVAGGDVSEQLGVGLRSLHGPLSSFNTWIEHVMGSWSAAASATLQEREASAACGKGKTALPALEGSLARLSRDDALLASGGFTPYVPIFVAQALSALDDHGAAVELLVDWLDDLDEVEAAARRHGQTGHEAQTAWFRLQTLIEALVLQKLSESSADGVPITLPTLRATLDVVFPAVLGKLADTETMSAWRNGSAACRAPDQRWKQGLVLSYFSWIKEYLDLLQRDLADDPSRLTERDVLRAGLIADINFDCFDWILVEETKRRADPTALAVERAASRVEFTTSAAAIRVLENESARLRGSAAEDGDKPLRRAAKELREAIEKLAAADEHDRSFNQPLRAGSLRRLIFPDPRQELLSNARAVLVRIEALRKQK